MPAVSKSQATAARMAKAMKAGKIPRTPGTPAAQMAKSMSASDLGEFARTKNKGLPFRVDKKMGRSLKGSPPMTDGEVMQGFRSLGKHECSMTDRGGSRKR